MSASDPSALSGSTPPALWPAPERQEPRSRRSRLPGRKTLGKLLIPLAFLLTKGKTVLLVLSKLKFFSTALSMVLSIGAYALLWGLPFAAGVVALLFVHEYGHYLQIKREGIRATRMLFIPFLGAVIGMKDLPRDAAMEARVGLAGPIVGTVGAAVAAVPYLLGGGEIWLAIAYTGFFLNLFNLVPISPLDGGRAVSALSPKLWALGIVMVGALFALTLNPFFALIAIIGSLECVVRWRRMRRDPGERAYYKLSARQRLAVAGVYFGLIALLVALMAVSHLDPDALRAARG